MRCFLKLCSFSDGFIVLAQVIHGSHIAKRSVPSLPVVKALDVPKDIIPSFFNVFIGAVIQAFRFYRAEKSFGAGVVPTVSSSAHASDNAICLQCVYILIAAVLAPLVRVVNQPFGRPILLNGATQSVNAQFRSHMIG